MVQSVLNHSPADKWDGFTPGTVFTQIPPVSPITVIPHPTTKEDVSLDAVIKRQQDSFREARDALEAMHRVYEAKNAKKRESRRSRLNDKRHKQPARFEIGDFVLVAKIHTKHISKLAVRWTGPARIVGTLNDWTFEVEDIRDGSITIRHSSRLQLYHDATLDVTSELLDDVAYAAGGHLVERVLAIAEDRDTKKWKVNIKWHGLEDVEASWEPLEVMWEDIPLLIKEWLKKNKHLAVTRKVQDFIATLPQPAKKRH